MSVGETVTALSLIDTWRQRQPNLEFVLSTTTSTAQAMAQEKAPHNVLLIYNPIDWFPCVLLSIANVRPKMLLLLEAELWPNLIWAIAKKGIPLALLNGRLSDSSAKGYDRYRFIFAPLLSRFDCLAVQTQLDADRIRSILNDDRPIHVYGNMKFDLPLPLTLASKDHCFTCVDKLFPPDRRMIICAASTHAGEESLLARVYRSLLQNYPQLCMIIIPRHAERAPGIAEELLQADFASIVLTELRERQNEDIFAKPILVVDTTGDLMNFLAIADIVFMGKSLAGNRGGHNIIEPAILSKPIVFGAAMDNFRQIVQIFLADHAALQVDSEQALCDGLYRLLQDPAERQRMAEAARQTVDRNRGASARMIDLLEGYLPNT